MSFPQDGLVTITNGRRLERARIVEVDREVRAVARVVWDEDTMLIYELDEGWDWARGHGDDIEAALLLSRSAK